MLNLFVKSSFLVNLKMYFLFLRKMGEYEWADTPLSLDGSLIHWLSHSWQHIRSYPSFPIAFWFPRQRYTQESLVFSLVIMLKWSVETDGKFTYIEFVKWTWIGVLVWNKLTKDRALKTFKVNISQPAFHHLNVFVEIKIASFITDTAPYHPAIVSTRWAFLLARKRVY